MKSHFLRITLLFSLFSFAVSGQIPASLRTELYQHIAGFDATIGISVIDLDTGDTLTLNDNYCYPTMSTYKFTQAVYVLSLCDKGKYSTDQLIHVEKADLNEGTWSPLRNLHPEGNVDVSIDSLLSFSVSLSDNNVCDILFDKIGSTKKVNRYLRKIGIQGMNVVATEFEMGENWDLQYANCSKPSSMSRLLQLVYDGKLLSEKSRALLMQKLEQTSTAPNRLKSGTPEGVRLLHKTGTGGTDSTGKTVAVNDLGILVIPTETGEKHLALSVFVSDSYESYETNEFIIAKTNAIVCSAYQQKNLIKRNAVFYNEQTNRSVPVLTYENNKHPNGKVVLLSGGYQSKPGGYDFLAEKLAETGYLVVEIQHDLENDPPIATNGNIYEQRLPIWRRGDSTIQFVCSLLEKCYPNYNWTELTLVGHSNGGDISLLSAQAHPDRVKKVITLDHRRMPVPLSDSFSVLTLRASDFEADPGVLPDEKEGEKFGYHSIKLGSDAKHNELCDNGSQTLKETILREVLAFLKP